MTKPKITACSGLQYGPVMPLFTGSLQLNSSDEGIQLDGDGGPSLQHCVMAMGLILNKQVKDAPVINTDGEVPSYEHCKKLMGL